jgi:hypothetical protein
LTKPVASGTNPGGAQRFGGFLNERIRPAAQQDYRTVGGGAVDAAQELEATLLGEAYGHHDHLGPALEEKVQCLSTLLSLADYLDERQALQLLSETLPENRGLLREQ